MLRRAEDINGVLQRVLGRLGITRRLRETDAVRRFAEVVGEQISQHAEAVSIDGGKLYVKVSSPTWRQELSYRKAEIAKMLNDALGENVVKDVFFVS
jgi:predicted nucleic acid-binding Zn ribbon protein